MLVYLHNDMYFVHLIKWAFNLKNMIETLGAILDVNDHD